jgi:hypothetical protein
MVFMVLIVTECVERCHDDTPDGFEMCQGSVNFGMEKVVQKAASLGGSRDAGQAYAGVAKVAHKWPKVRVVCPPVRQRWEVNGAVMGDRMSESVRFDGF